MTWSTNSMTACLFVISLVVMLKKFQTQKQSGYTVNVSQNQGKNRNCLTAFTLLQKKRVCQLIKGRLQMPLLQKCLNKEIHVKRMNKLKKGKNQKSGVQLNVLKKTLMHAGLKKEGWIILAIKIMFVQTLNQNLSKALK